MKSNLKKMWFLVVALMLSFNFISAEGAVLKHPAGILSELTGKSVQEIKNEHNSGKSYGEIAKNNGVLDKFKEAKLLARKEKIEGMVKSGKISAEEGQKMYDQYKQYIDNWDGSGKLEDKCKGGKRNITPNRESK